MADFTILGKSKNSIEIINDWMIRFEWNSLSNSSLTHSDDWTIVRYLNWRILWNEFDIQRIVGKCFSSESYQLTGHILRLSGQNPSVPTASGC